MLWCRYGLELLSAEKDWSIMQKIPGVSNIVYGIMLFISAFSFSVACIALSLFIKTRVSNISMTLRSHNALLMNSSMPIMGFLVCFFMLSGHRVWPFFYHTKS